MGLKTRLLSSPADDPMMRTMPTPHQAAVRLAAWIFILTGLALAPIFVFPFPGLQDYPNHIARAFILLHPHDPILERLYRIQWTTLPNLGWDIWAIGVGRIFSLEWTGKLFLAFSFLLILSGCFTLSRTLHGKLTFAPLLAVPFLFNTGFSKGFLSFNLAVGCSLFAAAWWISVDERHWLLRLFVATLFSSLLYIIHFYGWAFYGVFVLGYELQVMARAKAPRSVWTGLFRLGRDGLQAVPALAMLSFAASSSAPKFTVGNFFLPYIRIGQAQHLIDVDNIVASIYIVCIAGVLAYAMFHREWMRLRSDLAWPLAIMLALFYILPDRISGTDFVSWRILLMAVLVAIASLSPTIEGALRINQIMCVVMLGTAVIAGFLLWSWRSAEIGREDLLTLIRNVPDGSALFAVNTTSATQPLTAYVDSLYHVAEYAVLAKRALVQSMAVFPGQQPLRFRDPVLQSIAGNSDPFLPELIKRFRRAGLDLPSYVERFDYVVVHGPSDGRGLRSLPMQDLTLINRVQDYRLYQVNADGSKRHGSNAVPADHGDN
jgi:hypothetical protein